MDLEAQYPKKNQTFLWNLCVDGLPTKKRLSKSKIFVPQMCMACNENSEDCSHLFLNCPTFKRIWNIITTFFSMSKWCPTS